MKKRYRRPTVRDGQIKVQRGRLDGEVDMCIFYGDNTPRCDQALVMNLFFSSRYNYEYPSFIEELELRGYDLDTLKFSIERKELLNER